MLGETRYAPVVSGPAQGAETRCAPVEAAPARGAEACRAPAGEAPAQGAETRFTPVREAVEQDAGSGCAQARERPARDPVNPHELGRRGEDAAARSLERRGWEILARNWRTELGEVDIIARGPEQGRDEVTMVEVKTRRAPEGTVMPEEAVDEEKRRRYALLAADFLRRNEGVSTVRFDVVAVTDRCNGRASLRHTPNAFGDDE